MFAGTGSRGPRTTYLLQLGSLAAGGVFWQFYGEAHPDKLTPLSAVVPLAFRMLRSGEFNPIGSTMALFAVGVLFSLVSALVTCAATSTIFGAYELVRPYLYAFLAVPPLLLVPILMLALGPTHTARIVAILLFSYFPAALIFAEAVRNVPAESVEVGIAFGGSKLRIFWRVLLPMASMSLLAGTRLSVVRGFKGSIATELLMGSVGIGGLLSTFSAGFQIPQLYATILVIIVISLVIYFVLNWTEIAIRRRLG